MTLEEKAELAERKLREQWNAWYPCFLKCAEADAARVAEISRLADMEEATEKLK